MKRFLLLLLLIPACAMPAAAQRLLTPFERSGGQKTATYAECIRFYQRLQATTGRILIDSTGETDAGYPLHTIRYPATTAPDPPAATGRAGRPTL